jgi:pimeloyl-ACP methyl ester carboxylesterase
VGAGDGTSGRAPRRHRRGPARVRGVTDAAAGNPAGHRLADRARVRSGAEAVDNTRALADAPWFDETLPARRAYEFSDSRDIEVPVTVAWGAKDRLLLPRQARRAARALPRSRVLLLEGCGHVPTWDDPELVARVLLEGAATPRAAVAASASAAAASASA